MSLTHLYKDFRELGVYPDLAKNESGRMSPKRIDMIDDFIIMMGNKYYGDVSYVFNKDEVHCVVIGYIHKDHRPKHVIMLLLKYCCPWYTDDILPFQLPNGEEDVTVYDFMFYGLYEYINRKNTSMIKLHGTGVYRTINEVSISDIDYDESNTGTVNVTEIMIDGVTDGPKKYYKNGVLIKEEYHDHGRVIRHDGPCRILYDLEGNIVSETWSGSVREDELWYFIKAGMFEHYRWSRNNGIIQKLKIGCYTMLSYHDQNIEIHNNRGNMIY